MNKSNDKKNLAWDVLSYSDRRFDFLLVSISGGGIYICLETLKFLSEQKRPISLQIKIAGALFALGIILNLISQYTSKLSNRNYYLECDLEEEIEMNKENTSYDPIGNKINLELYKRKSSKYDLSTTILTVLNAILVISGLVLLICYFIFYL